MDWEILIILLSIIILVSAISYAIYILRSLKSVMQPFSNYYVNFREDFKPDSETISGGKIKNNSRKECFAGNVPKIDDNPVRKTVYLNTNSTNQPINKQLNHSDNVYPENEEISIQVEDLKKKIYKLTGSDMDDQIVFTSSCTESFASIFHWISTFAPYSTVCGTSYDHKTVQENCELYNLDYDQNSLNNNSLPDNVSALVMTQVNPVTGEILEIERVLNMLSSYSFVSEISANFDITDETRLVQRRPLVILDATQSIGKLDILMHNHNPEIDIIVASLHKLGFAINFSGLLILNNRIKDAFVPLIAGAQQDGLRGGSYNMNSLVEHRDLLDHVDDINSRKSVWEKSFNFLTSHGLNVYKPKGRHLYNTLLVDTNNHCPLQLINDLAVKHGIYVGNKTACTNEENPKNKRKKQTKQKGGKINKSSHDLKPFDNAVRISFISPDAIDENSLTKIADEINKTLKENISLIESV